ncbi:30S ribosomal protein THX [Marivirga sp.]|uniref:30S ribosomal protein THX n=1 Tax=Marivirga sp. TaxID=2018662 RepID=UPI002D7F7435|nr:30S ribosomal protein THX [Marivirga sp.]HET8859278.1 30S ribosomal protein THX [Marivirga sp.]
MGKGDKKSKKGKIFKGSFGNSRPRPNADNEKLAASSSKPKEEKKADAAKKAAPEKKTSTAKKTTAKKKTEKADK